MVIPPTVLFEIAITPGVPVPARMPVSVEPAAPVQRMLPVADELPMVFPVTVPTLIEPVTTEIPEFTVEVDEVETAKLRITLFWTLLGVAVPTDSRMPIKVWVVAPVWVQGVPPAEGALPPTKLLLTLKLIPVVSAIETPIKPLAAAMVRLAVW